MDWSYPLRAASERHASAVALRFRGTDLTFGDLDARVDALARGLAGAGLSGAPVAWMLPNVPEAVEVPLAIARAGAVGVPVNLRLTEDEKAFILGDSRARALVVTVGAAEEAAALRERVPSLATVVEVGEAGGAEGPPGSIPEVDERSLATITYTSGTTGFPKGVERTHRANAWNVANSALGSPRDPRDVELFTLPAYGIGLLHFLMPALLGGATVVLDEAFDPRRTWQLLEGERATRTFLAPTMMASMLAVEGHERYDLSALEILYTAYELSDRLRARVVERFGADRIVNMYGLTEVQLTCARPGEFAAKPTSVGRPMGLMRVRILGDDGQPVARGDVGEIALEGPAAMSGYHARPEETAASMRDGWVLTGDLGRLDDDGDLHFAGRLKDMIKTGGFSVDPVEVQRAVLEIAEVADAAVVGVPDDHWGEMVVAFVVTAPGSELATEEVRRACRRSLAGYKVPKHVVVLDALPRNATGKVERGRLRDLWASARPD